MTITEITVAARKEGLTYGKYVQKYGPIPCTQDELDGEKHCKQCGKTIPKAVLSNNKRAQFCGIECYRQYHSYGRT